MNSNTQPSAGKKLVIGALSLVAMGFAIVSLIPEEKPSPQVMTDRVERFAYAAGVGLADHLASSSPDARIRVLLSPQDNAIKSSGKVADGLEAGLRGRVKSVERIWATGGVVPSVENAGEEAVPEPSEMEDAVRRWEADTDLLILLFDPPPGLLKAHEEGVEGKPDLAVVCPDVPALLDAIEKGVISAAVAAKPDAPIHHGGQLIEPPEDPMAAFTMGFELVTPQNVGAFKERYPYLLAAGRPETAE